MVLKVLMVNTEFNRGGAVKIARTLYHALNKRDKITCYFAYGRGKGPEEETIYKFAFLPEIYFQAFLTRTTGLQGYGSWFSTKKLEKYIIKENFDLIHLHNLHGYFLNLSFIIFLKELNKPVIWTLHDGWALTGRCAYWFDCNKWKEGCGNCPDLFTYPKTFIDSSSFMWKKKRDYFSSGWNPVIVCPSQWLANRVKDSYLEEYQVKVIPNAINTEIFKPKNKEVIRKRLGILSKERVILFAASDLKDERKGARYFFEALNYAQSNNFTVITIGGKIRFDKSSKNNYKIKQLGYIRDKEKISEIYNCADIFCITSLDDNFPTTVLEALACGVPVVGFRVGGIPEQVTEDCGIMLKSKDTEALGGALEKLLNDEELRRKFSENCRKRALQNYTIEKFTDNYIKVYNDALRGINK